MKTPQETNRERFKALHQMELSLRKRQRELIQKVCDMADLFPEGNEEEFLRTLDDLARLDQRMKALGIVMARMIDP